MKIGSSSWNHLDRVDGTQTRSEQAVSQRFAQCLDVLLRELVERRPVERARRVHSVPAGGGGDQMPIVPLGEEPEQFRSGCRGMQGLGELDDVGWLPSRPPDYRQVTLARLPFGGRADRA